MKKIFLALIFALTVAALYSQESKPAFWDEIQGFKKQDTDSPPPKNAILFVGSSSFRKWEDVQTYFPAYPIINRGFGGSSLPDVIRYADQVIFPYQPKQIVIYCGENDVASSDTITASTVVARFKTLFELIRSRMPNVPVAFVSLKPSPSRWKRKEAMISVNASIKKYLATKKKTAFINVWSVMLDANGMPVESLFLGDRLHMTPAGYAIWQKAIAPYLLK